MVASMTAFSRQSQEAPWGSLVWELRSVNHRYLDISLRLPEVLRHLEPKIRQLVQQRVSRGKVEAILKFKSGEQTAFDMSVNNALVAQLAKASDVVREHFHDAVTHVSDILNWPGVLQTQDANVDQVAAAALVLLNQGLDEFVTSRQREGASLKLFMEERLLQMQQAISGVEEHLPAQLTAERKRILDRFLELKLEVNQERLEQEMLFFSQKMDVTEELKRLEVHLDEVQRVINQGGVVGRRLDFLMQELNREANTLTSKSIATEITKAAVDMKVSIEQMREQVQNIE